MIKIYVDGGLKKDYMYISIFSLTDYSNIKYTKKLAKGTSNTAEEMAIYSCIKLLEDLKITDDITIFSDYKNIVDLINSNIILKDKIKKKHPQIIDIKDYLSLNPNVKLQWIKGTKNLAHPLIEYAYSKIFFNEVLYLSPPKDINLYPTTNTINIFDYKINNLTTEIENRNLIIDKLNDIINELKNSNNEKELYQS